MDHDRGLFSLYLQNALDEAMHVDVVKMKRKKVVLRLKVLKEALEDKDYEKANFIILDICDKILNDPYVDEYNMTSVQVDMIVFSSAITNITVKYYDRTQQIITSLIMKYRNPIFYFVLGVSFFYKLCFQEAKEQFNIVVNLLENQKNATFPWPDNSILIITSSAENIRENALCFLNVITLLQHIKPSTKAGKKVKHTTIEISSSIQNAADLNVGIGKFVQYEIYPCIQNILKDVIKFDKWKLPADYQKIVTKLYKPIKPNSKTIFPVQTTPLNLTTSTTTSKVKDDKKSGSKDDDKTAKKSTVGPEEIKATVIVLENVKKKEVECESHNAQKEEKLDSNKTNTNCAQKINKKSQSVQVQPKVKSKTIQTNIVKTASIHVQTSEDTSELSEKNGLIMEQQETIAKLKKKVNELTQKQKNKDTGELIDKNRIISEQQEVISKLRIDLHQASSKQKEIEVKLNKTNTKINELTKTNKTILAEMEKYKESSAELRNYNQILEKSAKSVGKDRDEVKLICKNLFRKYKDSYSMQIQFYEGFQRRCENVLSVLNSISIYLTEITIPTKDDCQTAISEWLSALLSCTEALQVGKKHIKKYDKINVEEILYDLPNVPPLLSIKEPIDILLENIPILIYTIKDYESMLQNRTKREKAEGTKKEAPPTKRNFNEETDCRKKINFMQKNDNFATWINKDPHALMFQKRQMQRAKELRTTSNNDQTYSPPLKTSEQSNLDTANKKMRTLISYLKQNIPHKTESEITEALNDYRKQNNGSLSGMTLHYILYNVLTILETPQAAYNTVKETCKDLVDEINGDVCPICIEIVSDKDKSVLACNHVYHTPCIREWLSRNRVCAVCRVYTVLDVDFPPLKT